MQPVLKIAGQNFFRNFWLSTATIIVMALMLFSISFLVGLNVLGRETVDSLKNKIDLSVYLNPNLTENQINDLKTRLENLPAVTEINFVPPEKALEQFKTKYQKNPLILKSLEELNKNPLGAVLIIKARQSTDYQNILNLLDQEEYKEMIQNKDFLDYEKMISVLNRLTKKIQLVVLGTSAIFVLIAILIVFNTIRLTIYARQEEIKIMKLVGATSWFIRGPFLLESCLYAFSGWLINSVVFLSLVSISQPYLNQFLGTNFNLINYFKENFLFYFGYQLLLVLLLCIISSWAAIKKYLKT